MAERASWQRRDVLKSLSVLPAAWMGLGGDDSTNPPLIFSCAATNDLYRLLASASFPRYESPEEAVARAERGSGVLILAEGYPEKSTELSAELFRKAAEKKLRVYVEFPSFVPGVQVGAPRAGLKGRNGNLFERIVVASDALGSSLERLSLLDFHDALYVPAAVTNAELALARVAGFDKAVYGLPAEGVHPILFQAPEGEVLVGATKLSQFVTGRYEPVQSWAIVWNWILEWLRPADAVRLGRYQAAVRPSFGPHEALPADAERRAFQRGVAWYSNARLLVDPSWEAAVEKHAAVEGPSRGPSLDWPVGDGSEGLLEGFSTIIEPDGSQLVGWHRRNDCMGETSMAMALSSAVSGSAHDGAIATNLNNFIYRSPLAQGPRNDPASPSYGLVGWELPDALDAYWGDDNARSVLGTLAAAAVLKTDRWDELALRCLLGNFRTTGKLGFREDRMDEKQLQANGWRHFYNAENVNYAPHFQAYPWAAYLWAWDKTRYAGFLDRTKTAIRMTMAAYPNQWRWTNGIQQERARMLLPLAWLVRIEDTPEHRGWLRQMAEALLALQVECGALREEIGALGMSGLRPPQKNAEYGMREAPLIQKNGEPVCDLLYTSNFAFLGLHEAAAATGDPYYSHAGDRLAELFCRIQVRSAAHPELEGGWMRAFDYRLWEPWGSDSDDGWGVWSIETGWTQSWITSVFALRHLKTSYWQLTTESRIGRQMDRLLPVMLPG